MTWLILVSLLLLPVLLPSTSTENTTTNQSVEITEDFHDVTLKRDKNPSVVKYREKCTIPCELAAKLMKEERHSLCSDLQHSIVSSTRSTRKMIRDLIDEQQKSLELLSNQLLELVSKVSTLGSEVQRSNTETLSTKPVQSHGRDCSDIKETLYATVSKIPSGIYIIHPENTEYSFEVFCEMDYMDGGWTVVQRRTDGLTDFKRTWSDYMNGFGHLPGEHWLGLRKIFNIVNQKHTHFQLHIALTSQDDTTSYASYDKFWIEDETNFFRIHLGRYAGSAGDAFRGYEQEENQETAPFSTSDIDNDGCNPFCTFDGKAVESCSTHQNGTGWWFNQCGRANLNGSPLDQDQSTLPHMHWETWTKNGLPVQIKSVTMKIRRMDTPQNN
ncbi:angiopoietin-related protein 5 [Clupea harengus]|uniref:Angiopoietin-related protein 5 n=1 Tax=Clupea harengus TaxID=7950 RepID=A0A6P8FV61_CLUHA|nr:angiopoietin-related protein 5 [Clupea harengus]